MPRLFRGLSLLPRLTTRPLLPLTRALAPAAHARPIIHLSFFRSFYNTRTRLTSSPTSPHSPTSPTAPQTLSGRLKTLIALYGWYALGVHLVFSALDFGVAFAAINFLGAHQVAYFASSVKTFSLNLIGRASPENPRESDGAHTGHSLNGSEGLYAVLVLAYTVHKTLFLPVRVGLTVAFTPRFVGWLHGRGWAGTDGARRAGREIRERLWHGSKGSNRP